MRKEKESNQKQIIVYFIAFIMVSSIFGIMFSGYNSQSNSIKYKGIKFTQQNNQWSTTINNQKLLFNYLPIDVEQITLNQDIKSAIYNKPQLDITSDVNDTFSEEIALAQYTIALALNNVNIYPRPGFTTNNKFNLSIITCKDATQAVPVILFKQSNQTKVSIKDNCIIAEAKNNFDILRIKDRLLYSILGVIG